MGINNNSLNSDKLLKNRYILYGGLAVFGFIVLIVIYLYNIEDEEAKSRSSTDSETENGKD